MAEKYSPNFNDSRILSTTQKALNFVELYTKATQKKWLSSRELYKHFGNTSRQPGRWLKEQLLIVADKYYNPETGVCMKYYKNTQGVAQVRQLAGLSDYVPQVTDELEEQLDTGNFEYLEKSDRLYNPLQFIPKQARGTLLANKGYRYHYDIEAAAQTLLIQRAQKLNQKLSLDNLKAYTENRTEVRNAIAKDCEITPTQVKFVITAILQGGVISRWQGNKIFEQLNYNCDAVIRLNNNPTLTGIKRDISQMWKTLKSEFSVRYITDKNGRTRKKSLSGRDKSSLYRALEKEVGDVVRTNLKKNKIKALWIHDGWCCDKFVNPLDVELEVRRQTGYCVRLECNIYEDN